MDVKGTQHERMEELRGIEECGPFRFDTQCGISPSCNKNTTTPTEASSLYVCIDMNECACVSTWGG